MASVDSSAGRAAADTAAPGPTDVSAINNSNGLPQHSKWFRLRQNGTAMTRYLLDSEVHTYAFSVAANAILSFIPLVVLLYTIAHTVFRSEAMVGVIDDMIQYFFPSNQAFIARNLAYYGERHGMQVFSLVMILISCTGIFLPLEVALNQAWGVRKSRNYLFNQAIAFGLAIWMVVLGMTAMLLGAGERQILGFLLFHPTQPSFRLTVFDAVSYAWLAICTGVASILFFFSIYWILPNCKVPARSVMRASVVTGVLWLVAKLIFVAVLPHLDLRELYGPFYVSVGLLFWAYISGLILFAGAQVSVARMGTKKP